MKSRVIILFGAAAAGLLCARPASADQPVATLVYRFTFSANQAITAHDSANPAVSYANPGNAGGSPSAGFVNPELPPQTPSSGISHYGGALTDKGTMTVDVLGTKSDGGLVVSISEQGDNVRRSPPATCVVYGNTIVLCDPSKTVYTEEYTLLRFLGTNFVDPNQINLSKRWSIGPSTSQGQTIAAAYSIASNNNGNMQIGETRKVVITG